MHSDAGFAYFVLGRFGRTSASGRNTDLLFDASTGDRASGPALAARCPSVLVRREQLLRPHAVARKDCPYTNANSKGACAKVSEPASPTWHPELSTF